MILTQKNTVIGNHTKYQTETDADGKFTVSGIAPDTYKLSIMKDGYLEYETELDVASNKDSLKIYLDKSGETVRLTGQYIRRIRMQMYLIMRYCRM